MISSTDQTGLFFLKILEIEARTRGVQSELQSYPPVSLAGGFEKFRDNDYKPWERWRRRKIRGQDGLLDHHLN